MAEQGPSQPLFLARQSYRNRRLSDAARVIPVLGAVVFMLPLLWTGRDSAGGDTGTAGLWLFLGWFILIVITAALSRRLRSLETEGDRSSDGSL